MILNRNMHRIDQVARITLGIALIYIGFIDRGLVTDPLLGILLGVFGIMNLGSGILGVCPVYLVAGLSTLRKIKPSH